MTFIKRLFKPASPQTMAVEARLEHQRQLVLAEQRLRREQLIVAYHKASIERLGDLANEFREQV